MKTKIIIVLFLFLIAGIVLGIFCFLRFGILDLATIGCIFVVLGALISLLTYLVRPRSRTKEFDDD